MSIWVQSTILNHFYLKFCDGSPDNSVQLLGRHSNKGEIDEVTVNVQRSNGANGVRALLFVVKFPGAAVKQDGV